MFDVSFSELLIIAIVALLVIGPEKLPKVARTIGALTGRMQRYASQVKEEVNRELRFEELQKLQQEIRQTVESAEQNASAQMTNVEGAAADLSNYQSQAIKAPMLKPRVKSIKTNTEAAEKKSSPKVAKKSKKVEV